MFAGGFSPLNVVVDGGVGAGGGSDDGDRVVLIALCCVCAGGWVGGLNGRINREAEHSSRAHAYTHNKRVYTHTHTHTNRIPFRQIASLRATAVFILTD